MTDGPGGAAALRASGPYGFRYQYLAGGANTGNGWATWNPDGSFVTRYAEESFAAGITPVFTYYMLFQSSPGSGMAEKEGVLANLANASTMRAYWLDLELVMKRAGALGDRTVVVHVEPDAWGYAQQYATNDDARTVFAQVAGSGLPALAGLPDDIRGFAQAAKRLRDMHAPNVVLAYHLSVWGTKVDISISDPPDTEVDALGTRAAAFYRSLETPFDISFTDIADRDSAFKQQIQGQGAWAWWDDLDFRRNARFLAAYGSAAQQRTVIWQIPLGNTRMRAQNNTWDHFQDNRVERLLDDPSRALLDEYVRAGVVALLFGRGADGATCACDDAGDGVTDPPPINGNTGLSLSADDDGGFFRQKVREYYARGAIPFAATSCDSAGTPTFTTYLPNITKTLGGPDGWVTPFIVQNIGAAPTTLEVSFYAFSSGALVACEKIAGVAPGTSYANVPNEDPLLHDDTQFAVIVRSFGSRAVAVVNQQRGAGAAAEAMSYSGITAGSRRAYLPNVARRFNGYGTPFIVQNVAATRATATIDFASFDGSSRLTLVRAIEPGRSVAIDPDATPGLIDGTQYSVVITADVAVAAVLNASLAGPAPVSYSHNALAAGGRQLYAPYVAKRDALGRVSPVVVQNVGSTPVTPRLSFTGLGSFTLQRTFTAPVITPGRSWVFDPRFDHASGAPCGATATTGCLADGAYSLVIGTTDGEIAAVVLPTGPTVASAYTASATPATRLHLPNVTRELGGAEGWSTPIVIQSAQASRARLQWRRFDDGALVLSESVVLPLGEGSAGAVVIDPRDRADLPDGQYSVTIDAENGPAVAIVIELARGGDSHMIYEGFVAPD